MRKLLILNIVALAMSATLAVLIVRTTTKAADSLALVAKLTAEINHADAARKEMLVMGDSMRGFLLDPTQQTEWNSKMAADEALVVAVESLLKDTTDPRRREIAKSIQTFDAEQLNPAENRVLEAAKVDRAKATSIYFAEYFPLRQKQMAQVESLLTEVQKAS